MSLSHVLAVVPVADFDAARVWYERLFGRAADNLPMAGLLVEWQVTDSGWVQITHDAERADTGLLNFAVDDLPQHLAELTARGPRPHSGRHHSGQPTSFGPTKGYSCQR